MLAEGAVLMHRAALAERAVLTAVAPGLRALLVALNG
jgi:hypothetical protein